MRVHQLSRPRDEGAVAILVALLSTVLIGVSAFAVDFGQTYVVKRNVATGADAAALAAAKNLAVTLQPCAAIAADAAATAAARTVADGYLTDNIGNGTRIGYGVTCDSTGSVNVSYGAQASSKRALGSIFGSGDYAVARDATAVVGVATTATGLRPYALCLADLNTLRLGGVRQVNYPSPACGDQSGNWYSLDCPPTASNSTVVLAANTKNGCSQEISIIDTSDIPAGAANDPARISRLTSMCPALQAMPGCLTGNTGNLPSNNVTTAFDAILDTSIQFPVFFPGSVTGVGNGARYPVYALAGATICGYHFNNQSNLGTSAACAGSAFVGTGSFDAMLLKLTSVVSSGSTKTSTCALGDVTCDYGARVIRLIK